MKAKAFLFVILFVVLLIYAPALAEKRFPSRIISLGPSITESLYLLGEDQRLVGVTSYCRKPTGAKEKEIIGTVRDISIEKAIGLQPDLVIATSLTNPKAVEKLRRIGITVIVFREPKNYARLCEQFAELAQLVGKEEKAARIVEEADNRINALREKMHGFRPPEVFVQIGSKPLFAATGKTFINDFIVFAGAHNIAADAVTGLYSREEVLRRNPEIIFIVTMGMAGVQEKNAWQKYKSVHAVKDNRIYIIDSDKVCSPTPLKFAETLEEIASVIHPQLKR